MSTQPFSQGNSNLLHRASKPQHTIHLLDWQWTDRWTHHSELSTRSPNPGVSTSVSSNLTPFSSMFTVDSFTCKAMTHRWTEPSCRTCQPTPHIPQEAPLLFVFKHSTPCAQCEGCDNRPTKSQEQLKGYIYTVTVLIVL